MTKAVKVYYGIGEVAAMFDVNASLIRFWEKEFVVLRPKKNKKGNRLFTPQDVKYLHMIYHLVKVKGYTLQGAKDELKNKPNELEAKVVAIETLMRVRGYLLALDSELAAKQSQKK